MSDDDDFLSAFARSWRAQQQRLWRDLPATLDGANAGQLIEAEQAWREACSQWWATVQHVVPQPMAPQIKAALQQTALCMGLALRGARIPAAELAALIIPAAPFTADMSAGTSRAPSGHSEAERDYLRACQALVSHIVNIANDTLQQAREQAGFDDTRSPRENWAHCAHLMERIYLQHAGGDAFSTLLADCVDAHVRSLAERRDRSVAGASPPPAIKNPSEPFDSGSAEEDLDATTTRATTRLLVEQMQTFTDKLADGVSSLGALGPVAPRITEGDDIAFELDGVRLLHYRSSNDQRRQSPLLVVYSLVNRPWILDLREDRSLMRALCATGRDVYLIDWGDPPGNDAPQPAPTLHDYINRYLHECVRHVQQHNNESPLDLVGICQGGPFALCYAALEPQRVRRLALMVSPVDFHAEDFLLAKWSRAIDVDALVAELGNVPGQLLNVGFEALRPVTLSAFKALELLDLLDQPGELAARAEMERWLHDSPDQSGAAFAEFISMFVRDNALVNGAVRIGARDVDLRRVHQGVLNLYALRDHIVPPAAAQVLPRLLPNADCVNQAVDCGHIGIFTSRHTRSVVPRMLDEWFSHET